MTLPPITKTQKQILIYLYTFRFLNTTHFQKLFNHKNSTRILSWLKDLTDKGYICSMYQRDVIGENTKPAIYHLAAKTRHILKKEENCDLEILRLVYKEKRRTKKFIDHCLAIADVYLFFLADKKENETLKFFTKTTLSEYEYFPKPCPDGYISIKTEMKTKRYFLDLFDPYTPPFVYRRRIRQYLNYSAEGDWQVNTDNAPFPAIYFVCHSEAAKKHAYWYGKNVTDKSFEEVSMYVTTKETMQASGFQGDVWKKIE